MSKSARARFTRIGTSIALVGTLMCGGCATPTPFQPASSAHGGGGYSDQQIEGNRYRVTFTGNAFTSQDKVETYLLYRSAQLAVQNGFDGFTMVVRSTNPHVRTSVVREPGAPGAWGYWGPSWRFNRRGFGWGRWDPWDGTPFWGDTIDVQTVTNYEASAEIVLFSGKRPDDLSTFDAREVLEHLGPSVENAR